MCVRLSCERRAEPNTASFTAAGGLILSCASVRALSATLHAVIGRQAKQRENKQLPAVLQAPAFAEIIRNLSYAEQRFDSRSEPLFRFFSLITMAIEALRELWEAGEYVERVWARDLLTVMGGEEGYDRLVSAAVVGDAMQVITWAIDLEQRADDEVSCSAQVAARTRSTLRSLLVDGAIWLEEASGTLVHTVLSAIRDKIVFVPRCDGKSQIVSLGWPSPDSRARDLPRQRAIAFFNVFDAYFNANFPCFDESNLFAAFDLTVEMPLKDRSDMLRALALRHGKDVDKAVLAFASTSRRERETSSGLLAQARYHHSAQGRLAYFQSRSNKIQFPCRRVSGLPAPGSPNHMPESKVHNMGLRDPDNPNVLAWVVTLRELGRKSVDPRLADLVYLIELYVSRLAGTGTVERWLGEVALLELKRRADHLKQVSLESALKLRVQDIRGRVCGNPFDPRALLVEGTPRAAAGGGQVLFAASKMLVACQSVYREFYGSVRLAARSLSCVSLEDQAQNAVKESRPKLCLSKVASTSSIAEKKKAHARAVDKAVAARAAGHCLGPLGPLPQLEPVGQVGPATSLSDVIVASRSMLAQHRESVVPVHASKAVGSQGTYFGQASNGAAGSTSVPAWPEGLKRAEEGNPMATCIFGPKEHKKKDKAQKKDKKDKEHNKDNREDRKGKDKAKKKDKAHKKEKTHKKDASHAKDNRRATEEVAADDVPEELLRQKKQKLTPVEQQAVVFQAREAAQRLAFPGKPIPYVDSSGFGFAMPRQGVDESKGNLSKALPKSLPPKPDSSTHPRRYRIFNGPGLDEISPEHAAWAKLTGNIRKADAIVVDNIGWHWASPLMLAARLYGKRVADVRWLASRMAEGQCVQFASAIRERHMVLHLSSGFAVQWPDHVALLKKAAVESDEFNTVAGKARRSLKRLRIHDGPLPEKPEFPRLTWGCVADSEHPGSSARICTLRGLLQELSQGGLPCTE